MTPNRPRVSVLMANFNGAPFIARSLRSALGQSLRDLEIIVCDDASTDDSLAAARQIAAADDRVRVIASDHNAGISATRNRAIEAARGEWLAVQDSDDLFHPERLARLLEVAVRARADLIADDLLEFPNGPDGECKLLVGRRRPFRIAAPTLMRRAHVLGYLKPVWRADAMRGVRYNTEMVVAEDFDFACRMVANGARYVFHPEALYFYRKHDRSISAGSDRRKQRSILAGDDRFRETVPMRGALHAAAAARRRKILRHIAYDDTIEAFRRRDWTAALRTLAASPSSLAVFRINVEARLRRLARTVSERGKAASAASPFAVFLARADRLDGLAEASRLAEARGLERRLLVLPSPDDAGGLRRPPNVPGFAHVAVLRSRKGLGAVAEPAAEALFIARHARRATLVVAADPSLAAHLAYRIDDAIPALVEGRDRAPSDTALLDPVPTETG